MARRTVSRRPCARRARGFTLLETALALMIVLVGVLAIMEAQTSFIKSNNWSSHEATATYLANEIRERMRNLPRHDPIVGLVSPAPGFVQPGMEPDELTVDDMDDADDYNNVLFANNGVQTFLGPIDAFGDYIHETDNQGFVVMSGGQPVPLPGWSQYVQVEKVDPYEVSHVRAWEDLDPPVGAFPGRAVDDFPLRITVTVFYQGLYDPAPNLITTMSWVAPDR